MRRPEIPITCGWGLDLRHMEGILVVVGFKIIEIGGGGTAAVDGQLSVVEGDTVECGIGHGVVGLPFARTKGISEALRGRELIGGGIHGLCVADMEESIAVVGLNMWLGVEARTVLKVNTRSTVFELALVPLWLWLWLWL